MLGKIILPVAVKSATANDPVVVALFPINKSPADIFINGWVVPIIKYPEVVALPVITKLSSIVRSPNESAMFP